MSNKLKYTPENIADASTPDIILFAKEQAGLAFEANTSRDYMLEQIFDALSWLHKDPTKDATHVVLKIAYSPEEGGMHDVRLGHNGRMMTLKRETEQEVPVVFYNALMDINSLGYELAPLDKEGKISSGTPVSQKIVKTKFPVMVIRFVNKGTV